MSEVRGVGDNIWRPYAAVRLGSLAIGAALLAVTAWLWSAGDLSLKDQIVFAGADVAALTLLPVACFRWRMVLDDDFLYIVFLRVRRLAVREIVDAKTLSREGLTFVLSNGREESFSALANGPWGHRKKTATRADLAARAVLCAAAAARGEVQPTNYRLPPMGGLKKALIEGGIWAFIVQLFMGS